MNSLVREYEPLAPYTTLKVGGPARFFIDAENEADVLAAAAFARGRGVALRAFGAGSNVLVPDEGVSAAVMRYRAKGIECIPEAQGTLLVADAGAPWEAAVDHAARLGLWGIENLAGIPGTVGGAAVQNIGAYGVDLAQTFSWAEAIDARTGVRMRLTAPDARLGYRRSIFKESPELIVTRIALHLCPQGTARTSYPDLARARESGVTLETPQAVARSVRAIRAEKFPDFAREGTAGSFWKNPVLSLEAATALATRYPELPRYPQGNDVKVPLGWLLDRALGLCGYAKDGVRLFERHALILVAHGASARAIDAFARAIEERVRDELGIDIQREVETFS